MTARLAAGLFVLLLAACAAPPTRPLPELAAIPPGFEMSGRLAVRQGERSEIARLRWTHRGPVDLWVIASPLGNEVARIESGADGATLTQAGGDSVAAPTFAALTERLLGVGLEPESLAAWLHGETGGAAPAGWTVTLEEMQPSGPVRLARRISASRGDVVVRLVVDDYRPLQD